MYNMVIRGSLICYLSVLLLTTLTKFTHAEASSGHDEIQKAILEGFFQAVPVSDVCKSGSTATEISFKHSPPLLSNFNPQHLQHEKDLFLVEMINPSVQNTNQTWRLRLGSGGNVYSFHGKYGEAIPPQYPAHAPFMDEVWQNVAVDHGQHKPGAGKKYFIHQAGAYFRENEVKKPFFSPTLAVACQNAPGECMVASLGTQAHIPTTFASSTIYLTRYVNCGDGVIEITSIIYNHAKHFKGPHHPDHFNIPWGGVRTSTLPDMFLTTSEANNDETVLKHLDPLPRFGATINLPDTAGYTVFATPARKDDTFTMPFIIEEEESDDDQQDDVTNNSTSKGTDKCDVTAFDTCRSYDTNTVHLKDDSPNVKTKTKAKKELKLILAKDNACTEISQVMNLPLATTISLPEGHKFPLTFINERTRHTIEVESIEHWNKGGIFFRTKATVDEINSAFAAGDEIIVEKHDRLGLAFLHGSNGNSLLRYGVAGNSARDYTVFTVIVREKVDPGEMLCKRHYVITDSIDDIKLKAPSFTNDVYQEKMTAPNVKSILLSRPLFLFTTDFVSFGLSLDDDYTSCHTDVHLTCVGSTTPTNVHNSMLFLLECGNEHYVGHNIHHFAPDNDDDYIRLNVCKNMPDISPKLSLLGFVAEDGCKKLEDATYDEFYCTSIKSSSFENDTSAKDEL